MEWLICGCRDLARERTTPNLKARKSIPVFWATFSPVRRGLFPVVRDFLCIIPTEQVLYYRNLGLYYGLASGTLPLYSGPCLGVKGGCVWKLPGSEARTDVFRCGGEGSCSDESSDSAAWAFNSKQPGHWKNLRAKGPTGPACRAELKVTHLRWRSPISGFLRFPAKIFGFLRKSAVFCGFLRPPNAGIYRGRVNLRKSAVFCENLRFGFSLSP